MFISLSSSSVSSRRLGGFASALALSASMLSGCIEPQEAPSVEMPVVVDRSGIVVRENNLGYSIKLTQARVVVRNIVFTVGGEEHGGGAKKDKSSKKDWQAGLSRALSQCGEWLLPTAHAHPGHFEGGEVTGELKGRFVLDWFDTDRGPQEIGTALLLYGDYTSANFVLGLGGKKDGLKKGDPLFGHTAVLEGVATKDGQDIKFVAVIDSADGREVLGIPFTLKVDGTQLQEGLLGFRLRTFDVIEKQSMFDGVDFAKIQADDQGVVRIHAGAEDQAAKRAYTKIRKTFQTQDQFDIQATELDSDSDGSGASDEPEAS